MLRRYVTLRIEVPIEFERGDKWLANDGLDNVSFLSVNLLHEKVLFASLHDMLSLRLEIQLSTSDGGYRDVHLTKS